MGSFIRQNFLPIALGLAGLVLILFGIFQIYSMQKQEKVEFQPSASSTKIQPQSIVVDIEGAVIKPGVYKLSSDSRIVDVLAAAGGMSEEADREWVEKNINLAKLAQDGLKIYIPRIGEEILSSGEGATSQTNATININTASASDLDTLPGVGAVTADKIISGRPYETVDDLLERKILSQSVFDKIKDKISAF